MKQSESNDVCTKGNNLEMKCIEFCKKHSKSIIEDVNVVFDNSNVKKVNLKAQTNFECANFDENCDSSKLTDAGLIAQEKLNDKHFDKLIKDHDQIFESGVPNFVGCKIPVESGINVKFLREQLYDYEDKSICDLLEYGAPVGFEGEISNITSSNSINHKGARDFEEGIMKYLVKEASYGAIVGPFKESPFSCDIKISPLNTVSKKGTDERRVILDLSFPQGESVNDYVMKDQYLGNPVHLTYPKVDDLVEIIKNKGEKCLLYKKDLKRAYRQIPLDPGDLHLVGFEWSNMKFCDRVLPMGLRSSSFICQRVSSAVRYLFDKMGYKVVNYLDDFGGADTVDKAYDAYDALGDLLVSCGLEESKQKGVAPCSRLEFLGVLVDTEKMTLEVTPERLEEISLLVEAWLRKKKASMKDLQSLLGKLHFVSSCVQPGRIFVSRLLNWLRQAFPSNVVGRGHKIFRSIPLEVKRDLLWWHRFLSTYNGISIMILEEWSSPDSILSSDSCLDGFGAISVDQFFHARWPSFIKNQNLHINCLELLAVVIATKMWGHLFTGKKILIFCDNEASVHVINHGGSKDEFMQSCLREITFIAAVNQFQIRAKHIDSDENRLSDCLSRWDTHTKYQETFKSSIELSKYEEVIVDDQKYSLINDW